MVTDLATGAMILFVFGAVESGGAFATAGVGGIDGKDAHEAALVTSNEAFLNSFGATGWVQSLCF